MAMIIAHSRGEVRCSAGSQGSLVGLYRSERRASLRTHRRCTSCPGHTARRSDSWRGVRAVRRMHAGAMRLKLRGDSAGEVQGGRNTKLTRSPAALPFDPVAECSRLLPPPPSLPHFTVRAQGGEQD
ncbi:hypothetical protein PsYK624_074050 [Phanerochaete sordida]|uniref:Uncharacterized protein n=1 Tax=Phanerochaete sordida TaxID=48140 RepID=A0A9P3LD80_9APHY|nr:hypothetical protein PsYK624_074050 [Phanerochaete sordida]